MKIFQVLIFAYDFSSHLIKKPSNWNGMAMDSLQSYSNNASDLVNLCPVGKIKWTQTRTLAWFSLVRTGFLFVLLFFSSFCAVRYCSDTLFPWISTCKNFSLKEGHLIDFSPYQETINLFWFHWSWSMKIPNVLNVLLLWYLNRKPQKLFCRWNVCLLDLQKFCFHKHC